MSVLCLLCDKGRQAGKAGKAEVAGRVSGGSPARQPVCLSLLMKLTGKKEGRRGSRHKVMFWWLWKVKHVRGDPT